MSESKGLTTKSTAETYQKRPRYRCDSDFVLNKRVPPRPPRLENEMYITHKSDFKGQLIRAVKLLESAEEDEIVLRGLGSAVLRTVNLALQTQLKVGPQYSTEVTTSTVNVIDDLEGVPDVDEQTRSNSAIKIRIYNTKAFQKSPSTSDVR